MAKEQKNKKKRKGFKKLIIVLFILLIIVCIASVFVVKFFGRMKENGNGMRGFLATVMGQDKDTLANLNKITFLLIGESEGLTDTLILCSYDPKTGEANMLSIPRDTFVGNNKNNAVPYDKINARYEGKYAQRTVDLVSKLTGAEIPYYVVVDTKAVIKLVDTIGGVDFDVPIDMKYTDTSQKLYINLKKGPQLIYGAHAEHLLRFRHNDNGSTYPEEYGGEDLGRMKTQKAFIKEALKKTLQPQNILKISEFLNIGFENVKTNMPMSTITPYIPYVTSFNPDNIVTGVLPGAPEYCNGVWLYVHNKKETQTMVNEMFLHPEGTQSDGNTVANTTTTDTTSTTIKKSDIKIELLNGSDNSKALSDLTSKLQSAGYIVSKSGNTTSTSKTSIINRKNISNSMLTDLKDSIGVGKTSTGTDNSNVHVTIIIGNDYK